MAKDEISAIAEEVVKIYFENNISVEEAIERAKEMIDSESSKMARSKMEYSR